MTLIVSYRLGKGKGWGCVVKCNANYVWVAHKDRKKVIKRHKRKHNVKVMKIVI